jgi:hypothetical protein
MLLAAILALKKGCFCHCQFATATRKPELDLTVKPRVCAMTLLRKVCAVKRSKAHVEQGNEVLVRRCAREVASFLLPGEILGWSQIIVIF